MPDVTAPVQRFHQVLVDEIRKKRPDYLRGSFPLSEIYQRLVPYRSHRDELGLDMNGDYEDVLLRLLAGAGDLVILESDEARDLIRKELDSKNPNTGLFREFAATEVRLGGEEPSGEVSDAVASATPESAPTGEDIIEYVYEESAPAAEAATGSDQQDQVVEADAAEVVEAATAEDAVVEDASVEADVQGEAEVVDAAVLDAAPVDAEVVDAEPVDATPADPASEAREGEPGAAPRANGTYFDFETTDADGVQLTPARPGNGTAPTEDGEAGLEAEMETDAATAAAEEADTVDAVAGAPAEAPASEIQESTEEAAVAMGQGDCAWCGDGLPDRAEVNFCPHCGKTTKLKPCRECGDEMELNWKFCVQCGTAAAVEATAAA